jgi:hypothetical protein
MSEIVGIGRERRRDAPLSVAPSGSGRGLATPEKKQLNAINSVQR